MARQPLQLSQVGDFFIRNDGGDSIIDANPGGKYTGSPDTVGLKIIKTNASSSMQGLLISMTGSGSALEITNSGTGFDILAGAGDFSVSKTGALISSDITVTVPASPAIKYQDTSSIVTTTLNSFTNTFDIFSNVSGFTTRIYSQLGTMDFLVSGNTSITGNASITGDMVLNGDIVGGLSISGGIVLLSGNIVGNTTIEGTFEVDIQAAGGTGGGFTIVDSGNASRTLIETTPTTSQVFEFGCEGLQPATDLGANLGAFSKKWLTSWVSQYRSGDGTAASPAFTPYTGVNRGMYFPSTDQVGFSTAGTGRILLTNTALRPTTTMDLGATASPWEDAYFNGDVAIGGKLTVSGLIDPTGLQLTQQSFNPGDANTIWISTSGRMHLGQIGAPLTPPGLVQGRLTINSSDPIPTTSGTSSTLYLLPYKGNIVSTFNGTQWESLQLPSSGISFSVGALNANTNYDVFVSNNLGTLELQIQAWYTSGVRFISLALQDGAYVKSGTPTALYLGTVRTNSTPEFVDSVDGRFVWNYHNRIKKFNRTRTLVSSWTATAGGGTGWEAMNGGTSDWVLPLVIGVKEDPISAYAAVITREAGSGDPGGPPGNITIGINSTTTPSDSASIGFMRDNDGNELDWQLDTRYMDYLTEGNHIIYTLQRKYDSNALEYYNTNSNGGNMPLTSPCAFFLVEWFG